MGDVGGGALSVVISALIVGSLIVAAVAFVVEVDLARIFSNPADERTENYVTGRFG